MREICRFFIRFDAQDYTALPAVEAEIEAIKAAKAAGTQAQDLEALYFEKQTASVIPA